MVRDAREILAEFGLGGGDRPGPAGGLPSVPGFDQSVLTQTDDGQTNLPPLQRPGTSATAERNRRVLEEASSGRRSPLPTNISLAEEAGRSIARIPGQLIEGAGGLLQILSSGLAAVTPLTSEDVIGPSQALAEFGQSIQPFPSREAMEGNEGRLIDALSNPNWWASVIPGEAAQLAATLTGAGAALKFGRVASFAAAATPTALREGGVSAVRSFERGVEEGLTPNQAANQAAAVGGMTTVASTALEFIPFMGYVMRSFGGDLQSHMARQTLFSVARQGAFEEGVQEPLQEIAGDTIQAAIESDSEAFDNGLARYAKAAVVGGLLGAGASVTLDRFSQIPLSQRKQKAEEVLDSQIRQPLLQTGRFNREQVDDLINRQRPELLEFALQSEGDPQARRFLIQAALDLETGQEQGRQRDEAAGFPRGAAGEQQELSFRESERAAGELPLFGAAAESPTADPQPSTGPSDLAQFGQESDEQTRRHRTTRVIAEGVARDIALREVPVPPEGDTPDLASERDRVESEVFDDVFRQISEQEGLRERQDGTETQTEEGTPAAQTVQETGQPTGQQPTAEPGEPLSEELSQTPKADAAEDLSEAVPSVPVDTSLLTTPTEAETGTPEPDIFSGFEPVEQESNQEAEEVDLSQVDINLPSGDDVSVPLGEVFPQGQVQIPQQGEVGLPPEDSETVESFLELIEEEEGVQETAGRFARFLRDDLDYPTPEAVEMMAAMEGGLVSSLTPLERAVIFDPSISPASVIQGAEPGQPFQARLLRVENSGRRNPKRGVFFGDRGLILSLKNMSREEGGRFWGRFEGKVHPFDVSLQNPLVFTHKRGFLGTLREDTGEPQSLRRRADQLYREYPSIQGDLTAEEAAQREAKLREVETFIADVAREKGHDGIVVQGEAEAIVLHDTPDNFVTLQITQALRQLAQDEAPTLREPEMAVSPGRSVLEQEVESIGSVLGFQTGYSDSAPAEGIVNSERSTLILQKGRGLRNLSTVLAHSVSPSFPDIPLAQIEAVLANTEKMRESLRRDPQITEGIKAEGRRQLGRLRTAVRGGDLNLTKLLRQDQRTGLSPMRALRDRLEPEPDLPAKVPFEIPQLGENSPLFTDALSVMHEPEGSRREEKLKRLRKAAKDLDLQKELVRQGQEQVRETGQLDGHIVNDLIARKIGTIRRLAHRVIAGPNKRAQDEHLVNDLTRVGIGELYRQLTSVQGRTPEGEGLGRIGIMRLDPETADPVGLFLRPTGRARPVLKAMLDTRRGELSARTETESGTFLVVNRGPADLVGEIGEVTELDQSNRTVRIELRDGTVTDPLPFNSVWGYRPSPHDTQVQETGQDSVMNDEEGRDRVETERNARETAEEALEAPTQESTAPTSAESVVRAYDNGEIDEGTARQHLRRLVAESQGRDPEDVQPITQRQFEGVLEKYRRKDCD